MEATQHSPFAQTVLEPGVVTIGSTPENRLVLHDAKVSPHHAALSSTEQGYTITDLWSTECTFVNDQRLEPLVPRLLTAGDRIRIGEVVFTYEVHEGAALLAEQRSRPADEPTVLAASSESRACAQSSTVPPEQTASGSAAQIKKKPLTSDMVKANWKNVLMVLGLIGVLFIINVSSGTLTNTSHTVPLAPKLVVLHHQFYNRPMEGCIAIGYPIPLVGRDSAFSFPDPLKRGTVTYRTSISQISEKGITFLVEVKFLGNTYQSTIGGVKPDDGVQIMLSNRQNNGYIATKDVAQFAVAGAEISISTGNAWVWIHFTYQKLWHWQDVTKEL